MAISFVGSFGEGADSGNLTPTLPAGISFGDAVGAVGVCSTAQTLTAPSGWTVKSGWPKDSGNARVYTWTKDSVTSSDSSTSPVWVSSAGNKAIVEGFVLHSSGSFDADWTDQLNWQAHTSGTTYTAPSSTSGTAGCWGVAAFVVRGTDPTAWNPASGLTERQDLARAGGGATAMQLCDSGGSIGGASTVWGPFSATNVSTSGGGGLTWLVKEATAGGGGGAPGTAYPVIGLWRDRTGVAWRTAMNAAEAIYGPVQGHWGQYFGVGSVPLNAITTQAIQDGKRLHVFWKAYDVSWADTAAGNYDTEIDAAAASIAAVAPAQVWLTIHHEPEDDYIANGSGGAGWTAANYRGMWQRVRDRFNLVPVTNVTWVLVWQNSHSHPNEMITLYGNDGVMDALVDVVSQQDYIAAATTPGTIATKWLEDLQFLADNETANRNWGPDHKPQAFTEWGADHGGVNRGTNTHRAQTIDAIRGILPDLAAKNVAEVRYFDARTNEIDDPPAADGLAFQALKDASEAGQTTPPIFVAGVSLARDGLTATATTIPFVLPSGWQQGDFALAFLSSDANPSVTVVPTGWTLHAGPTNNGAGQRGWVYKKTLAAGEVDPTWTIGTAQRPSGVLVTIRGASPSTPIHASNALTTSVSGTSHATPTLATTLESFQLSAWLFRWADASGNGGVNYGVKPGSHTTDGAVSPNSGSNVGAGALVAHLTANPAAPGTLAAATATVPVASTGLSAQFALLAAGTSSTPLLADEGAGTDTLSVNTGAVPKTLTETGTVADTLSISVTGATAVMTPKVELALTTQPMAAVPAWTDITQYVRWPAVRTYGRPDEFSDVTPGTLRLRLDNSDGRFTMGKTDGAYYPNVRVGKRIRYTESFNGVAYIRFDGHVDGWPNAWTTSSTRDAEVQVTATDRLKRSGPTGELRSLLEEEILRDAAVCYFPLSEPDGATSAASIAKTSQPTTQVRQAFDSAGGTIEFGAGTGPGTDQLSAAIFTPVSQANGKYLFGSLGGTWSSTAVSLEAWFNTSTVPTPDAMPICSVTTHVDEALTLAVGTLGRVVWGFTGGGAQVAGNTSPLAYNDGHTHQAVITLARSGTTVTARLYVDGAQVNTATFTYSELPFFGRVDIGGSHDGSFAGVYTGTLSHVAAYPTTLSATRVGDHYHAGADGLTGERTDTRIGRVADYIAIPTGDRAFDQGDSLVGGQATSGKQPLDAMREAERTEQGVLFIAGDGKLTFHKRSRRYNQTPVLTLDGSAGRIQVGLSFPSDDFGLVNDYTVSRPGGAGTRAVNQTSIDEYGLYRDSAEVPAVSDDATAALAQWRVGTYGDPRIRVPNLTVSLQRLAGQSPTQVATLLGLDISSMIRLSNLPSQAPASTIDVFVEGWTETINRRSGEWTLELNCSPADGATVWQFATAGFSEFATTTRLGL